MLLSIIIPIYNLEKYIDKCLESITSTDHSHQYEIICINDGSTDNILKILSEYDIPNLKIISIKKQGVRRARNTGIEASTGKYILFLVGDDSLEESTFNQVLDRVSTSVGEVFLFN